MRASLGRESSEVVAMFDGVANSYDLLNDMLSLGQDHRWRRATAAAVAAQPGQRVLDLAAGTGTSSTPYLAVGAQVVACDLSPGMIAQGRARHPELTFVLGDATALPFEDGEFDVVTMSFGLRNVADYPRALREMRRVVRPGGRVVICEFSQPVNRLLRWAYQGYLLRALPLIAGRVAQSPDAYQYLAETIRAWLGQAELAQAMQQAGWRQVGFRNLSGGIVALHRGTRTRR